MKPGQLKQPNGRVTPAVAKRDVMGWADRRILAGKPKCASREDIHISKMREFVIKRMAEGQIWPDWLLQIFIAVVDLITKVKNACPFNYFRMGPWDPLSPILTSMIIIIILFIVRYGVACAKSTN